LRVQRTTGLAEGLNKLVLLWQRLLSDTIPVTTDKAANIVLKQKNANNFRNFGKWQLGSL